MKQTYSFDDVLLIPQYSEIESRGQIDISNSLNDKISLALPVISSPMDTVTEDQMAVAIHRSGGLGVIHRYMTIEAQSKSVFDAYRAGTHNVAAAIGMAGDFLERAVDLVDAGANILCVDVAHGHHTMMKNCLDVLKNKFGSQVHIMAGNVATLEAFEDLASWGADSIRVGIGGGSICSTRIVSGHGVPTLQSIIDCAQSTSNAKIIADGGIKTSGDMVKALAAGADFVMVGSILAGTNETPGQIFTRGNGKKYKVYRGMASSAAQNTWRGKTSTPEGVSTTVPFKGSVVNVFKDMAGGLRSGLSYSGCRSINELQAKARFVLQSFAGQNESNTHILWRNK